MDARARFIRACLREPVDRPPCWLMRQAGRYLPEYRELREKYDFLTTCRRPDLAVEISLQPWRRFAMDAVIVFSDILLVAAAMGPKLSFVKGEGPTFDHAIRTREDVERLSLPDVRRTLAPTLEALEELRFKLKDTAALVGFVGSPWTVASYMVEGGGGDFRTILDLTEREPELVMKLLDKIAQVIAPYAVAQVKSGADAVQIFDTWGGLLSPQAFRIFSLPFLQRVCAAIRNAGAVPILFVRKSAPLFEAMMESGAGVLSVGPESNLAAAASQAREQGIALQGNLDPEVLLGPTHAVREATRKMLSNVKGVPGYIANLGHGVLPKTPVESVATFVETVTQYDRNI